MYPKTLGFLICVEWVLCNFQRNSDNFGYIEIIRKPLLPSALSKLTVVYRYITRYEYTILTFIFTYILRSLIVDPIEITLARWDAISIARDSKLVT